MRIADIRTYSVLLPGQPDPQERYSAQMLAEWIDRLTGFAPAVLTEPQKTGGHVFSIGRTRLAAEAGIGFPSEEQGYRLAERRGNVFLIGGTRGPFQAVMALIEEDWGVRWFSRYLKPTYAKANGCSLTVTPRVYAPPFEIREYLHVSSSGENREGLDWFLFNRGMNVSYFTPSTRENGGGLCAHAYFIHTYSVLVPAEKYGKEHPEYYPMRGGKRVCGGSGMNDAQLCYTCKGVEDVIVAKFDEEMSANPDAKIWSLSANDNLNLDCECPTCAPLIAKEGVIGAQIDLANRVARRLRVRHPHVILNTTAYAATQKPPASIVPDDNVAIFYAPIWHRSRPLVPWRWQKTLMDEEFLPWTGKTRYLMVWDYARTPHAPCPNFHTMRDNIRLWRAHGVKGVFIEDNEWLVNSLDVMKSWVFAKLLWNPDWDLKGLMDEFIDGAYGAAAPAMRDYVGVQIAACRRAMADPSDVKAYYLEPAEVERMRTDLDRAFAAVRGGPGGADALVARELVAFLHERLAFCRPERVEGYRLDLARTRELTTEYGILLDELGNRGKSAMEANAAFFARCDRKLENAKGGGAIPVASPNSVLLTEKMPWYTAKCVKDSGALAGDPIRQVAPGDWYVQFDLADLVAAAGGMQEVYVCRARLKPELVDEHGADEPICGVHFYRNGVEGAPGASARLKDLPRNGEWGIVNFFRVTMYSSAATGTFFTTTEKMGKRDAVLFDYLEFVPEKDFKDKEALAALPLMQF